MQLAKNKSDNVGKMAMLTNFCNPGQTGTECIVHVHNLQGKNMKIPKTRPNFISL